MSTRTIICENCGQPVTRPVGDEGRGRFCSIRCARAKQVMRPREERFWRKVERRGPDECWPWKGARHYYGHGVMFTGPRSASRQEFAHRISYEVNVGPIPEGLDILHSCDNPPCVNPAHLRPGTQWDNNRDRDVRGRQRHPSGPAAISNSVLTEDSVRAIRQRRAEGGKLREIAAEYGVSLVTVHQVVTRKTWKHVE